eukprot:TRINITY_DN15462_c0_g1_i2.p1 TRINITY_DN15462_c0_g1~~TRINITY_DN15462_c0_g1_i2.p1  ORF type:complete len:162 (-),score=25.11 TRINITY_DN15462_c0_g1_i2:38-523(-)
MPQKRELVNYCSPGSSAASGYEAAANAKQRAAVPAMIRRGIHGAVASSLTAEAEVGRDRLRSRLMNSSSSSQLQRPRTDKNDVASEVSARGSGVTAVSAAPAVCWKAWNAARKQASQEHYAAEREKRLERRRSKDAAEERKLQWQQEHAMAMSALPRLVQL